MDETPQPSEIMHKLPLFEVVIKNKRELVEHNKSSALLQSLVGMIFRPLTFPTKWHAQIPNILVS
jgi:hypothetical protein